MAVAGYLATVKVSGTSTATTGEAVDELVVNTTYQVHTAAKRIIDPTVAVVVKDGGTPIAATGVTVDYLFGKVTLASPPGGTVTMDFNYLPMLSAAEARSAQVSMSRTELDKTILGDTDRNFLMGLKTAEGSVDTLDLLTTDLDSGAGVVILTTLFAAGTPKLLEVYLGSTYWRGWILLKGLDNDVPFDGLITGNFKWKGTAFPGTGQAAQYASFGVGS